MQVSVVRLALLLCACGARSELGVGGAVTDAAADAPFDARPIEAGAGDSGAIEDGRDGCVPLSVTFSLPSTAAWTATGLDVTAGSRVVITAQGKVQYGGQAQQVTGPDGGNFDGQKFFSTAVLPNAIVVSLIGKVGGTTALDTGAPLPEGAPGSGPGFVGSSYDRTMTTSGTLFLGFNDQRQAFGDNVGSFQITITITC